MPWFKVDDRLHSHPKVGAVLDARPGAMSLWVIAGSWCAATLTDGRVPAGQVKRWGFGPADAAALVSAGLWHVNDGGWIFHDWHEYQPTKADVVAERTATATRVERWRNGRRNAAGNTVGNAVTTRVTNSVGNGVSTPAPIPIPIPEEENYPRANSSLLTWQRASRVWADALGRDTTKMSIAYHAEHFKAFSRLAQTEAELVRVLETYKRDEWVKKNNPAPKHLAAGWDKYANAKRERTPEERAAYDAEIRRRAGV